MKTSKLTLLLLTICLVIFSAIGAQTPQKTDKKVVFKLREITITDKNKIESDLSTKKRSCFLLSLQ